MSPLTHSGDGIMMASCRYVVSRHGEFDDDCRELVVTDAVADMGGTFGANVLGRMALHLPSYLHEYLGDPMFALNGEHWFVWEGCHHNFGGFSSTAN